MDYRLGCEGKGAARGMEGVSVIGQPKRRRLGSGSKQKTRHYNCISHCKRQDKKREEIAQLNCNTTQPLQFYPPSPVRFSPSFSLLFLITKIIIFQTII